MKLSTLTEKKREGENEEHQSAAVDSVVRPTLVKS